MENSNEDEYTCPSFSSYSSNTLAEIAVKVVAENSSDGVEDDDDFEFSLVREDGEVLADEFLRDGLNAPFFPVFNHDLLRNSRDEFISASGRRCVESSITVPLSKLLLDNRENQELDNPPSCSSSDYDELENIPAGTYCVWRPKTTADQPSPSGCKKSKSTGSMPPSKRWRFCDFLRRSNSEGKDSFVFLIPKKREEKSSTGVPKKAKEKSVAGGGGGGGAAGRRGSTSAHEALYVRYRAIKEEHKKKSFLPYRQDLVGIFVNVNALSKGFPNF